MNAGTDRTAGRAFADRTVALAVVGIIVVSLVVAATVMLTERPEEQGGARAYPGSDSQSLARVEEAYKLHFPACVRRTLQFADYRQGRLTSLYARFGVDRACFDSFLAANNLADAETFRERGLPRRWLAAQALGWPIDGREFTALAGSDGSVHVEVSIDDADDPPAVYLYATRL